MDRLALLQVFHLPKIWSQRNWLIKDIFEKHSTTELFLLLLVSRVPFSLAELLLPKVEGKPERMFFNDSPIIGLFAEHFFSIPFGCVVISMCLRLVVDRQTWGFKEVFNAVLLSFLITVPIELAVAVAEVASGFWQVYILNVIGIPLAIVVVSKALQLSVGRTVLGYVAIPSLIGVLFLLLDQAYK